MKHSFGRRARCNSRQNRWTFPVHAKRLTDRTLKVRTYANIQNDAAGSRSFIRWKKSPHYESALGFDDPRPLSRNDWRIGIRPQTIGRCLPVRFSRSPRTAGLPALPEKIQYAAHEAAALAGKLWSAEALPAHMQAGRPKGYAPPQKPINSRPRMSHSRHAMPARPVTYLTHRMLKYSSGCAH